MPPLSCTSLATTCGALSYLRLSQNKEIPGLICVNYIETIFRNGPFAFRKQPVGALKRLKQALQSP